MKKCAFIFVLIFFSNQLCAQSNWEKFRKLSAPYKKWVVFHPFKAKKALEISMEATVVSDSIAKTDLLDQDKAGGQADAFRHAYWTARLQQEIGKRAAISLGKAHEKDNYKTFKKNKTEDGVVPDQASKEMDLFNNKVGLQFSEKGILTSKNELVHKIINAILKGDLKVIKKDTAGNFLTCDGEIIPSAALGLFWQNSKCLIPSNK
ncbi:MAG: hypothetical protein RQ864_09810 [Lutibacter sp.]|nr:hypothetical protein [Lutibacter sp.]MDT8418093.1 hypothetical protein [Lutibacter sp.]